MQSVLEFAEAPAKHSLEFAPLKYDTHYEYAFDKDSKTHIIRDVQTKDVCDIFIDENGYSMVSFGPRKQEFLHVLIGVQRYDEHRFQSSAAHRTYEFVEALPNDKCYEFHSINGIETSSRYRFDPVNEQIYLKMKRPKKEKIWKVIRPNINGSTMIVSLQNNDGHFHPINYRTFLREVRKINPENVVNENTAEE